MQAPTTQPSAAVPAQVPTPTLPLAITAALDRLGTWLWPAAARLPAPVQARAQRLWLDTASCAWAGLQADEPARWLAVQAQTDGGAIVLPGSRVRLGASAAATTLALAACWDEACEGLAVAHGRPGVPVVAALWTQLAALQPDWRRLWQATAVGYEIAARLGAQLRIQPGLHVDGMWGAFGAAAAIVHLRGGSWAQAMAAIEACAVQLPYSLYRPVRQGANVRNLYLGHSAWLGLQAAQAVAAGLATPHGAVDDFAALALKTPGHWPEPGQWLILDSYWKPFAAVRHVHYGAQAAHQWLAQGGRLQVPGDAQAIEALQLQVYPEALHYCPNRDPQTVLAAQFSLSFGVAAMLRFGDLSPAEFRPPRFTDAGLRRLEALIDITADAAAFPDGQRGARLSVLSGGTWHQVTQGAVTGDAHLQPDDDAVQAKFARFTQSDPAMARWAHHVRNDAPQAPACLPC